MFKGFLEYNNCGHDKQTLLVGGIYPIDREKYLHLTVYVQTGVKKILNFFFLEISMSNTLVFL